jgi:hypothetical protein
MTLWKDKRVWTKHLEDGMITLDTTLDLYYELLNKDDLF